MIKTYSLAETDDKELFRVVNWSGDWNYYYHEPSKTYLPAVSHVLSVGFNKGERFAQYLLTVSKEEAKKRLESAGSRGSRVHDAIGLLLKDTEIDLLDTKFEERDTGRWSTLTLEEWKMLVAFTRFWQDYKPKTEAFELPVHNLKDGYAGTLDWLGTVQLKKKRAKVLIDWKTSSAIWAEYPLQASAYRKAKGLRCATGVLRLGTRHKSGYEFKMWTPKETEQNFNTFLSVKQQFHYHEPEYVDRTEELPGKLKLHGLGKKSQPVVARKTQG